YPLCYGCSHFLGTELEAELRDWYFICNAGIYTASIMANGDIAACLDIERRPELIQGNIRRNTFKEVWLREFRQYRDPSFRSCEMCDKCEDRAFCNGDSFHTWNFDEHRPELCMKEILKF
ncbi:MAG: SPASM domain-containing protein, partial [Ruminiclostridium sp.]|nr:SPASM domain-containing protein [Ruminiclostridium sp.]